MKIFFPPAQRPVRDAKVNNVWRYTSTPPYVFMIKGLNFYFQILQNKNPNILEPIPHLNDISLDSAGLLSETKGRTLLFYSQDQPEYTGGPNVITILRFFAKFSWSAMTRGE